MPPRGALCRNMVTWHTGCLHDVLSDQPDLSLFGFSAFRRPRPPGGFSAFRFFGLLAFRLFGGRSGNLKPCLTMGKPEVKLTLLILLKVKRSFVVSLFKR